MSTELEEKIRSSLVDNRLPCSVALKIAKELKVSSRQVGDMANRLRIRIIDCQLGCFEVKMATHDDLDNIIVDRTLAAEIEASLVNSRLPCAVALNIARKLKATPKEVGDAATKKKIKLSNCQLGCFA